MVQNSKMGTLFSMVKHGFAAGWFWLFKLGSHMEYFPLFIRMVFECFWGRMRGIWLDFDDPKKWQKCELVGQVWFLFGLQFASFHLVMQLACFWWSRGGSNDVEVPFTCYHFGKVFTFWLLLGLITCALVPLILVWKCITQSCGMCLGSEWGEPNNFRGLMHGFA